MISPRLFTRRLEADEGSIDKMKSLVSDLDSF